MIGKTGSGKTTVAALVAMAAAGGGRRVVAVDTDVVPNLGASLGAAEQAGDRSPVVPRALARGRGGGGITVDQVLDGYGIPTPSGVTLLHAMRASDEPAGCGCPAHASARSLLASALTERFDLAVVDMEAGLEHLDRPAGTLACADVLVVVVEPSRKSLLTGRRMVDRARALDDVSVVLVGNKADEVAGDLALLDEAAAESGVALAGVVPFSSAVVDADRSGTGIDLSGPVATAAATLVARLLPS